MDQLDPLTIALVILVVAAAWAVVELALTLRRTRAAVSDLSDAVSETLAEARPVIAKLDGAADELVPATKRIEPILEKASTSVDLLNVDLVRVESILSDVGSVTGTGARVSDAVSGAADAVASGVAGAVGKVAAAVAGRHGDEEGHRLDVPSAAPAHLAAPEAAPVERVSGDAGYFTYPAARPASAENDEPGGARGEKPAPAQAQGSEE